MKERVQRREGGEGVAEGRAGDKATSVSDTNMAQCQQQYYVYAPSFSASHRATALHLPHLTRLTLPPAHPSASSACTQTLSAAILAYKGGASAPSASSLCGSLGSQSQGDLQCLGFFFFPC